MKIAIIGSGISGLTAAYLLSKQHEVQIFEKNDYIGGHTHTVNIIDNDKEFAIDTGFIVFNDWTYPNFIKLLTTLGVGSLNTNMSFSVKSELNQLEYNGNNLNSLFSTRSNLFNPRFLRMVYDILRFNKETIRWLDKAAPTDPITLEQYLTENHYSNYFIDNYIIPMGAAIWSASTKQMLSVPAYFFIRFFKNHGLLSVTHRPQWKVVSGGSSSYIPALTASFKEKITLSVAIESIIRDQNQSTINFKNGASENFDAVIFACHSDEALNLLHAPTLAEKSILSAIPYQNNEVVLHTDSSLMPRKKLAWASWNYHLISKTTNEVAVTYYMNMLQGIQSKTDFFVTLNFSQEIDPAKILQRFNYSHPIFTSEGIKAQNRFEEISGKNNTYYCGAYWRNGFHEDGVWSAIRVTKQFGIEF